MALVRIKLNLSNPAVTTDMSLVVGDQGKVTNVSRTIPLEAPPTSSMWKGGGKSVTSKAGNLVINQYYQSFEEDDVKRWNWAILTQLAALIDKQLVVVELSGSAQTAAQVRAMHVVV